MVTATIEEIGKRILEYGFSQTHISYFSGVSTAQLSRALNGLTVLSASDLEALDTVTAAMANMIHDIYEIPIDFAKVAKIEPVVRKYMERRRTYVIETRAFEAKNAAGE